jgi:hypothetical protein
MYRMSGGGVVVVGGGWWCDVVLGHVRALHGAMLCWVTCAQYMVRAQHDGHVLPADSAMPSGTVVQWYNAECACDTQE